MTRHHHAASQRGSRLSVVLTCAMLIICVVLIAVPKDVQRAARAQGETEDLTVTQTFGNRAPESIINTFTNPTPITIPSAGAGTPYPSEINVSGIPTQLAKVTVKLNGYTHTFPADTDVMLVGPQGQTAVIMSDVGSSGAVSGITLTIDDAAANSMPTGVGLTTATYKPTNSNLVDNFPAPAPTQAGNSALSVFAGTNPNGVWKLFAFDDLAGFAGSISLGFSLTFTAAISGQNTRPISIADGGVASPYPSDLNVVDHNNPVSRIVVTLTSFSHTSPDDVDIVLASPSGRFVTLMSDVGGTTPVTGANLVFDDSATASLPDSGAIVPGTYRPTDFEPGDVFPGPAPQGAPSGKLLSSMNGTPANGTWSLYIVDDSGTNVGDISGGWNILIATAGGIISFTGTSVASQYPTEITVGALPGNITRATVSLQNFSHTLPDALDMLLVGPDGRRVVLMSDAGGVSEIGAVNLTFDDQAAATIPDDELITSGSYRPADHEPGEVFPAPAPPGPPTGSTLGAFYGGVPNGVWRLFIVNDSGGYGTIAGTWSITLQTSTSACLFQLSPTIQAFPVGGGSGGFSVTQPTGCVWTASTTDSFITVTSGSSGAGNGSVGFSVAANQGPARTGTIDVSNGVITRSFQVQQPSGCPLAVSQSTVNVGALGGPSSVTVSAGGACAWQGSTVASWIQVTSPPQSGDGTLNFTVQPNTARLPRSGTIDVGSFTINVNQAALRSARYDFDGDARADLSVFRPSTGTWWISPSGQPGTVTANQFGISTDKLAPADYDGDLKTDITVYRDGTWYVLKSTDGTVIVANWGNATDVPLPADHTGDGIAEFTVWRPSTGTWWILNTDNTHSTTAFGVPTDLPTPGDYDGDGKSDLSVYRPATAAGEQGTWWILNGSNGNVSMHMFGVQGDIPVSADYDGDGRDNISVYRPSTGFWYRSNDPTRNYDAVQWGIPGDRPAPADYDGDGKADPAVVRTAGSLTWYVLGSTSGAQATAFGVVGDRAVSGSIWDFGFRIADFDVAAAVRTASGSDRASRFGIADFGLRISSRPHKTTLERKKCGERDRLCSEWSGRRSP